MQGMQYVNYNDAMLGHLDPSVQKQMLMNMYNHVGPQANFSPNLQLMNLEQ